MIHQVSAVNSTAGIFMCMRNKHRFDESGTAAAVESIDEMHLLEQVRALARSSRPIPGLYRWHLSHKDTCLCDYEPESKWQHQKLTHVCVTFTGKRLPSRCYLL